MPDLVTGFSNHFLHRWRHRVRDGRVTVWMLNQLLRRAVCIAPNRYQVKKLGIVLVIDERQGTAVTVYRIRRSDRHDEVPEMRRGRKKARSYRTERRPQKPRNVQMWLQLAGDQ